MTRMEEKRMEIYDLRVEGPVVNGKPHELEIEYTAPEGDVITLELYPSSFQFKEKDDKLVDTVNVKLPPSGVRTTHREKVIITGSISSVTIFVSTKPHIRRTRTFQPSS
ncbi:hypothetical protein [Polyangium mundeleinium]|uniref:Uncharacterized protein n=1 Tax=Polyangium mundeleinium TaxID=2995306 RepID=A0ABT5F495_9BACT|nr:hypothetical protein [Polyangium mundeleinium]MDC0748922.1 hypothetical protein [Polyangium mundeleinium]